MKAGFPIFNFSVNNQGNDTLDIFIDGSIETATTQSDLRQFFGDETSVSYASMRNEVEKYNPKVINFYINSIGGNVVEAMAAHDYIIDLKKKGVTVNTIGRGLVASAATYILMAGTNISMTANSRFMVHNVLGGVYGNVQEVENYAKTMRSFNNQIAEFYTNHTGLKRTEVDILMNEETWLTAQDAKDKGFVTTVTEEVKFTNVIKKENWQFNNTEVLELYNSFTKKNTNMKIDLKEIVTNAVSALTGKDKTPEAMETALTNALQPLFNEIKETKDNLTNAIVNGVNAGLEKAMEGTISKEDFDKVKNELDQLKKDVSNSSGAPNPDKDGNKRTQIVNKPGFISADDVDWEDKN